MNAIRFLHPPLAAFLCVQLAVPAQLANALGALSPVAGANPLPVLADAKSAGPRVPSPPPDILPFATPSEREVISIPAFDEAIAPIGPTGPDENRALVAVLREYLQRQSNDDASVLLRFLEAHPHSAWKPALLLHVGIGWRRQGYFSRALNAWEEGWSLSKTQTNGARKSIADRTAGELLQLNAWVGRYERLEPLLAEIGNRTLIGGASEMLTGAREAYWAMQARPETSFRCGPFALQAIATATKAPADLAKFSEAQSTRRGISLVDLHRLAKEAGLKYQMAKRSPGARIPNYSVMHWKLNHYGAIIAEFGDGFLVQDPTFSFLYGTKLHVGSKVIDEESSGYFLIPEGMLPPGWRAVTDQEAQLVWGKGITTGINGNNFTPCDEKACKDCGSKKGMAEYNIHLALVSLNIVDTPLGYSPPRGPAIDFTLTYNQRDYSALKTPTFSNLGIKWTCDWFAYIQDVGAGSTNTPTIKRFVSGGGFRISTLQSVTPDANYSSPSVFYPDEEGLIIARTAQSVYKLTFADGSRHLFSRRGTGGNTARVFLTRIEDSAGVGLDFLYEDPAKDRITKVRDALGRDTVVTYPASGDIFKIIKVRDPFGREATLDYDQDGRLTKITDVIGMASAFTYSGTSDFISGMTTPYGTSTFTSQESVIPDCSGLGISTVYRELVATDPAGNSERVLRKECGEVPGTIPNPGAPASLTEPEMPTTQPEPGEQPSAITLFNDWMQHRNTYYWDKKGYTPTPNYSKAWIYHWLHELIDPQSGTSISSGVLESLRPPLESRIWFRYPGQNASANPATYTSGLTLRRPCIISRLVDKADGTAETQTYRISYNSQGNVTRVRDPAGRVTCYEYAGNGIDVTKVRKSDTAGQEVVAEFQNYNSSHRPQFFIDASKRTTEFTWNAYGELSQIKNPKTEITGIARTPSGYITAINEQWPGGTKTTAATWDAYDRLHTLTDSEGYQLEFLYDALDRLTFVNYLSDANETYEQFDYDRLDLVRVRDRKGGTTVQKYDSLGRVTSIKDPMGRITRFGWCNCGGLESITDALNRVTSWTYDDQGRALAKTYPAIAPATQGTVVTYAYEPRSSRLKSVTDARNQTKNYKYYVDGTLKEISYANAVIATPTVMFTYDPVYRRLATATVQRPTGSEVTTYTYNPVTASQSLGAGRLATADGPLADDTISYGYDELGRKLSRSVNGVGESVVYDALGRITGHNPPIGNFTVGYVNATFRPSTITGYPDGGGHTDFEYFNNAGNQRLSWIKNWRRNSPNTIAPMSWLGYQYDAGGSITNWTQLPPNEMTGSYTNALEYDLADQLIHAHVTSDTQPAKAYTYRYDAAGNRLGEQQDSLQNNKTLVSQFSVNEANQLSSVAGGGPTRYFGTVNEPATVTVNSQSATVKGNQFSAFVSVPLGNQTVSVFARDYGAGAGNTTTRNYTLTLDDVFEHGYQYDANGNRTGRDSTVYEWDAEDRLVTIIQGTLRSEFTYDAFGRRVRIVEKNGSSTTSDKRFVWDGGQIRRETDSVTGVTKWFYGEGVRIGTTSYFYTRDHLGSIREMTDANGGLRARYDYDPYGRRTKLAGDLDADFGFTGHYYHAPSKLHLAWFRAYDAETGRWLNRDLIEEQGGLNLFGYVENDPVNWIDPSGESLVHNVVVTIILAWNTLVTPFGGPRIPQPRPPIGQKQQEEKDKEKGKKDKSGKGKGKGKGKGPKPPVRVKWPGAAACVTVAGTVALVASTPDNIATIAEFTGELVDTTASGGGLLESALDSQDAINDFNHSTDDWTDSEIENYQSNRISGLRSLFGY